MRVGIRRLLSLLPVAATPLVVGAFGCKHQAATSDDPAAATSTDPAAGSDVAPAADLPPDAPRLAPLTLKTEVLEHPDSKARVLGYLRLGQSVARSSEPTPGTTKCDGGAWYQIAPRGYVCVDDKSATLDLGHPIIKALGVKPDLSHPMPYVYGFVRRDASQFHFIPHHREMNKFEFAFQGNMKEYAQHKREWTRVEAAGANEVPLDAEGNAIGPPKDVPPTPPQPDLDKLFPLLGGNGEVPWWLVNTHPGYKDAKKRHIPNISSFSAPDSVPFRGKISRHAGVAVIGEFHTGKYSDNRSFVVTLDGRLIGEDKIKPHYASPFHGVPVGDKYKFPFAIVRKHEAYAYGDSAHDRGAKLTFRDIIPITGKSVLRGEKYFHQTTDGHWLHEDEVSVFDLPKDGPSSFDWKHTKWIDVSITYQTLVMYDGDKPVYATLVSTGADGAGDPKTTRSTIRGEFRIDYKHVTATMDADDPESHFELRDVPWVEYFEASYALHAAYWHDDFGRMRSHGCVNMSPVDARRLFFWTDPPLPEGWHGVKSGPSTGQGTWVRIRR
jgi:hypothetical protein